MKKISFLLYFLFCSATITVLAQSGSIGTDLSWKIVAGTLTISGTGAMPDYICGGPWCSFRDKIKNVVIEDEVKNIGNTAFYELNYLTSVTIGNSVTSIGTFAFYACINLMSVTIPHSVITIEREAFQDCRGLISLSIGNSVANIGNFAFLRCSKLTEIVNNSIIPQELGRQVFEGIDKSICILRVPTESVGTYRTAEGWKDFMRIGTPDEDYVDCFGMPFGDNLIWKLCLENGTLTISGEGVIPDCWNVAPWYSVHDNITNVVIENGVLNIGRNAFGGLNNLKFVNISESVVSVEDYAFYYCSSLTEIVNNSTIPQTINDDVFYGVDKLSCTLRVPAESVGTYSVAEGWKDFMFIVSLDEELSTCSRSVPFGNDNITFKICSDPQNTLIISGAGKMPDYHISVAPWYSYNIAAAIIENGITSIGNKAFRNKSSLKSVTIPESVNSIGSSAFWSCGLTSITIPYSVISIKDRAFGYCNRLKSLTIPNSVENIEFGAFENCSGLCEIFNHAIIPHIINSSVFLGVNKSTCLLHVPNESIDAYRTAEGWKDFKNIVGLISVSSVCLNKTETVLIIGEKETLIATIEPEEAPNQSVVWSSGKTAVATVNNDGLITAISAGTAIITATTQEGGKTATCTVSVTPLTGNETCETLLARVYPNPSNGAITLQFETEGKYSVSIADMTGRLLLRETVTGQTTMLDISNFSIGLYLLTIDNGKQKNTIRIVKN